jgi:tetratricopeptide (TPR) repeat protein
VAAFVLDRKFGLARGFNTYDDEIAGDESGSEALLRQRTGEAVVDAALAWLSRPRAGPFFCWVHLYDPHAPYLPHSDLFGDEFAERPYDAEIAYDDRQVGRLLEFLKSRGLDAGTLVVVVGDHGEGLGQHVEQMHGSTLYNATMRVPLLFRRPAQLPPGRRVASNVSLVDVFPTILELLGLNPARKISGRSVSPALQGGAAPGSLCYGATDEPFLKEGWSPLRSLTDGPLKYIRTTRVELYDLDSDPDERNNLAEKDPELVQAMESRLADFESRLVPRAEVQVQISGAERRALASLGYVGGTGAAPVVPFSANLADVKDMLPFDVAVDEANKLLSEGSVEAATERLRAIVRDAPGHSRANSSLAWALWDQSREDEAMDVFLSLLALKPDSRDAHNGLASMLLYRDRPAEAIPEFLKALEIDPEFAEAHYSVAKAFAQTGQPREALSHFTAVVEIDSRHAGAYQWRAHILGQFGQIDAAIADCRKALKYAPESPEAHHNLGAFLAEHGDAGEAQEHLARAVELSPQSAEFHYVLGAFLVRHGQFDEAIAHLDRAVELKPDLREAETALKRARQLLREQHPKSP